MPIIDLPIYWTVLLDSIAWAIIQPTIAFLSFRFPNRFLSHRLQLYRTRSWEQGGEIYQSILRVRAWKARLPAGATMFRNTYSIGRLSSWDIPYLETWVLESCRSELCHWVAILPSLLFFLWNPPLVGVGMVVYACAFNAIPIIAQRYNRPRMLRVIRALRKRHA